DAETAGLVTEGVIESLLLGAGAAGIGEPLLKVHLASDEGDQRDRQATVVAFDQLGELLGLLSEGAVVLHLEGGPVHEFVEGPDDGVVAEELRVVADRLAALVEADVLSEPRIGREEPFRAGDGGDEPLPLGRAGGCCPGALILLEAPARAAEQGPEGVVTG